MRKTSAKRNNPKSVNGPQRGSSPYTKMFSESVAKTKNPRFALQLLREQIPAAEMQSLFGSLRNNQFFVTAIAPDRAPRKFGRLGIADRQSPQDLATDLRWLAEVIGFFKHDVTSFLALEQEFEIAYLNGNNNEALAILNRIESRFGLSIWLISRKSILTRRLGSSQSDDYAKALISSDRNRSFMSFLVYMIGFRSTQM